MRSFRGARSILSGPAGGAIGFAETSKFLLLSRSKQQRCCKGIIGFDMGGTSTDVSRYDEDGFGGHVFDSSIAGVMIQTPHIDINTVAAGGGSKLFFERGIFRVGPESAGATPGPVCYGRNGFLTVTDANLVLGKSQPLPFSFSPSLFQGDCCLLISRRSSVQTTINRYMKSSLMQRKLKNDANTSFSPLLPQVRGSR